MNKRVTISVGLVTAYFFIFLIMVFTQVAYVAGLMFVFSPFLLVWMIYTLLRYGEYNGPELDDDEWGYEDKSKDELGIF